MQTYNGGPRMQTSYLGSFTQASYTGRMRKPAELMLVPMIDIFTVLVTFLLMTAGVFAHHDPASSSCRAPIRARQPLRRHSDSR
jgi:hypothetical protein